MTGNETTTEAPGIPDGVGLSIETVRNLLMQKHQTTMSQDDPMLMMVTLTNAFLGEYDRLLKQHNTSLTSYLESASVQHLETIRQASDAITQSMSAASIGTIGKMLMAHRNHLNWTTAIIAISAMVNVAVFVLKG
jgi:hypothetical protein